MFMTIHKNEIIMLGIYQHYKKLLNDTKFFFVGYDTYKL